MYDPFGATHAYTHNGDDTIMRLLGLRTHEFGRDWTPLGTVEDADDTGATIDVEVSALPAMFWRFTITRRDGRKFVCFTGSGSFQEFWRYAKIVAADAPYTTAMKRLIEQDCFDIEEVPDA